MGWAGRGRRRTRDGAFLTDVSDAGRFSQAPPERLPAADDTPEPARRWVMPASRADTLHDDGLKRARVWRQPAHPIRQVDFAGNSADDVTFDPHDAVVCRFLVTEVGGDAWLGGRRRIPPRCWPIARRFRGEREQQGGTRGEPSHAR